jgi:hypothetical protein
VNGAYNRVVLNGIKRAVTRAIGGLSTYSSAVSAKTLCKRTDQLPLNALDAPVSNVDRLQAVILVAVDTK